MKRFTSLFLVVTLTLSLALILGACGENKDVDNTTLSETTAVDVSEEITEETTEKSAAEKLSEIENRPERSTGEHYSEEYEKLTLPSAITTTTTKAAETTTKKNDTKVTTTKQSIVTTTKRATIELTTKKVTTTKKDEGISMPEINTDMFSQTEIYTEITDNIQDEYVGFGGSVTPSEVTRPEVTYYEKYVEDVIRSKNYTMSMQMNDGDQNVTLEIFSEGERKSYKGTVNFSGVTMSFRFFEKNGKSYVVLPTLLRYFEEDGTSGFTDGFDEAMLDAYSIVNNPNLKYCGITSGVGYVCESYKDSENNVGYNFYFNSSGLTRVETVDLETNECMSNAFSLKSGVADKEVFDIPKGYIKTTVEELENLVGGMM